MAVTTLSALSFNPLSVSSILESDSPESIESLCEESLLVGSLLGTSLSVSIFGGAGTWYTSRSKAQRRSRYLVSFHSFRCFAGMFAKRICSLLSFHNWSRRLGISVCAFKASSRSENVSKKLDIFTFNKIAKMSLTINNNPCIECSKYDILKSILSHVSLLCLNKAILNLRFRIKVITLLLKKIDFCFS